MTTVLKNVLSFSGLAVNVPVSRPHLLNVNGIAVAPQIVAANLAGFTLAADAVNVTVTRTTGGASVNVYVEHWHTIEDSEPPGGIGSNLPFFLESSSGLSTTVTTDGTSIQGDGSGGNPIKVNPTFPAVVWHTNQAAGGAQQNNAGGAACAATGANSFAAGDGSTASGQRSVAIGDGCLASGDDSLAMGDGSIASARDSHAIGDAATANAQDATAIGNGATASATSATALGSAIASGINSFAAGNGATASGQSSVALGDGTANGTDSFAAGTSTATGNGSTALGESASALREGQVSQACGQFAALGDAQQGVIQFRGTTPGLAMGESVELLFGANDNQQFTIPSNSFRSFVGILEVIATNISSGGVGPSIVRTFKQTIAFHENGGGVVTLDANGTQETLGSAGGSSWTFAASVPGGPFRLALTFTTGTTTQKTRVVATLRFTELVPPT